MTEEYFAHYFNSPFLDADMELDRAMEHHPSGSARPYSRYVAHCPVCGRGMNSASYLEMLPGSENGLRVCSVCRFWSQRLNKTEEKAPAKFSSVKRGAK